MARAYILYNERAGKCNALDSVKQLETSINDEICYVEITAIPDYRAFLSTLEKDDYIILAGGDGTLNHFVNDVDGIEFDNEVLYYPNGSGNDFARDLGYSQNDHPFCIREYIKDLPKVTVNGKTYRFINGVGFGIDGYSCAVGEELRQQGTKGVNYTTIAIKGAFLYYKPPGAKVTVDGETRTYKRVWLAPTMNGRYYGGGMIPTPHQKRNSNQLSTLVFHGSRIIKSLIIFSTFFKGGHLKYKKHIEVLTGKTITVEFDQPVDLQIDGEAIRNITSYTATVPEAEIA
ncbi:MAG: diacylglycerol kinase family protein [Agathobacter sp.]|nr:diacylglycerol kinase family protein [Agathobacter sp.]